MNRKKVIEKIKRHILDNFEGVKGDYAKHHGKSAAYISRVLSGKISIPDYILADVGVVKCVYNTYKEVK